MSKRSLSRSLYVSLSVLFCLSCSASNPPVFRSQSTFRTQQSDWFERLSPSLQTYYAAAKGKTGPELMVSLHQIISKGQKTTSYSEAKSYMYAVVDNVSVNNISGLYDAYSYVFVPGTGGNGNEYKEKGDENKDGTSGDFINCEHTWPQSFFNKAMPMVSDLHHLFPTLSKPNGMRSNHPIGNVTGQVVYSTVGGARLGATDRTGRHNPAQVNTWFNLPYEQQPHDILSKDFDMVFEPPKVQKGNTARALLYFYLRYYDANIRSGAFQERSFLDQHIPEWVQWAEQLDPIDGQERLRHEKVYQRQNNRNPFIDIPDLASLIGIQTLQAN